MSQPAIEEATVDTPEEPIVGTPADPAWPAGYTATLHTTVTLPHGSYPIVSAYPTLADAIVAAEKDCGRAMAWDFTGRKPDGYAEFASDRVPYEDGTVSYTIWDWS